VTGASQDGYRTAVQYLRNDAASRGANAVFVLRDAAGRGVAEIEGRAYRCKRKVASRPIKAECLTRGEGSCFMRRLWHSAASSFADS